MADAERAYINFDGASRGNPGPAGAGAIIKDSSGNVLAEVYDYLGENTNNYAEYKGLILALEAAAELGERRLVINADSELIVRQLQGRYRVKAPNLIPLYEQAKKLIAGFDDVELHHVPRAQNEEADRLANLAIDRAKAG